MTINRREFIHGACGIGAGVVAMATASPAARAAPASDRINLAVLGGRGRGLHLIRGFSSRADCNIAYICDVDQSVIPTAMKSVATREGPAPQVVQDFRRALDDKSVDA